MLMGAPLPARLSTAAETLDKGALPLPRPLANVLFGGDFFVTGGGTRMVCSTRDGAVVVAGVNPSEFELASGRR